MSDIRLTINEQTVQVPAGMTILEAARSAGIYIPALCSHPDLPPAEGLFPAEFVYQGVQRLANAAPDKTATGCGLCLVAVEGTADPVESCTTEVETGMVVATENDVVRARRQANLVPILARHRHACLTCAQQEGCSLTQCSQNVPENERCCPQFGYCELQNVANYIGISDATPKWTPTDYPVIKNEPLFESDHNLCIGCTRCVRACRDLRGVEALGFVHDENGRLRIGTLRPTLEESECRFCTACVAVCPTGAMMDKQASLGRKDGSIVPCREACPARVDVPAYLKLIASGNRGAAEAVIREKVPFPGVLGRVCSHPCEEVCRRGEVNQPVAICALKRYAADGERGLWKERLRVKEKTGKKVGVVGAGPTGLTAAFYLRRLGHTVTVFEARNRAGGMLRYGIPACRLPREVLDREIRDILSLGIELKTNQALGRDFSLKQLLGNSCDAVFLAVGAQLSRRIQIDGAEPPDVLWCLDFLRRVAEGKDIQLPGKVIVIGGGDIAVDVALSAFRCGAGEVTIVCLESREEMPTHEWEIETALAEGIQLLTSWGPHRILRENGRINGLELVRCTRVFDDQGRFNPAFDDVYEKIEGDQIILSVGQAADLSFLEADVPIAVERGLIMVDQETLETGMDRVYAGGDITNMPGAVIEAVASGRKAAVSIDQALGGSGELDQVLFPRAAPDHHIGREEGFAARQRERVPELDVSTRRQRFDEISLGYQEQQAIREAGRCLQCDLRLDIQENPAPPAGWLSFDDENISQVPATEGVYRLLDEKGNVLAIKGTADLRRTLLDELEENNNTARFEFEEHKMYSQRESELIQQYLTEHGEMPGVRDLDDLF